MSEISETETTWNIKKFRLSGDINAAQSWRSPVLQLNLSYRHCQVAHKASVPANLHRVNRQRLRAAQRHKEEQAVLRPRFGDWWVTCPPGRAYFNVRMRQCSSGLSKPNLSLTSWSPSTPHHLAVPTEGHNLERYKG